MNDNIESRVVELVHEKEEMTARSIAKDLYRGNGDYGTFVEEVRYAVRNLVDDGVLVTSSDWSYTIAADYEYE